MEEKRAQGRPTIYNDELAKYVCDTIATHSCSLKKLAKTYERFPNPDTIFSWIHNKDGFSDLYWNARRNQAAAIADSIAEEYEDVQTFTDNNGIERIDSGMLGRAKLATESKRWFASKMAPKLFGDKTTEELQDKNQKVEEELAALKLRLEIENKKEY